MPAISPCARWRCWRGCDLIAAEDTRVTAKLLAIHGISKPLTAYNDHNAARSGRGCWQS